MTFAPRCFASNRAMLLFPRLFSGSACSSSAALSATTPDSSAAASSFEAMLQEPRPAGPILTDTFNRFHKYLRVSLTERCNLRCQYCMPEEGVPLSESILTREEIARLVGLFVKHGVDKVRFTGGEPTVRKDLAEIIADTRQHAAVKTIAITTNGLVLARKIRELVTAGLNQVNVSLDTFVPGKFEFITRRKGHKNVLEAIDAALAAGIPSVKVNCVVMRDLNTDELVDFVEYTRTRPVTVRFIEYMPFDGNGWNKNKFFSYAEMLDVIRTSGRFGDGFRRATSIDGATDTTKHYKVDGFEGSVGFITSMSQNFCGTCDRLRLTADGNLKVCLFGANEVNLMDMMRGPAASNTDEQLEHVISLAVKRKKFSHAGMTEIAKNKNRPMIKIGG